MPVDKTKLLVGVGACVLNSTDVGGTRGGLIMVREAEYFEVDNIDQQPGVLEAYKIKERYTVKFEIGEATLENLKAAWELTSSITGTDPRVLTFGGDPDGSEVQLEIYGTAPNKKQRKVTFYKVRIIEVGEQVFKRDDLTTVAVTCLCINDTSRSVGDQIGKVEDSTT